MIQKTKKYDEFKFFEFNRAINPNHVQKLKLAIEQSNDLHLNPLIVTEDLHVIDGQHRLKAAEELGVDVYYLIDNDFDIHKIIDINAVKLNWTLDDFFKYWLHQGKSEYVELDKFIKTYNLTQSQAQIWVMKDGGRSNAYFKNGTYKFQMTPELEEQIKCLKRLTEFVESKASRKKNAFGRQRSFLRGAKTFFSFSVIKPDRFFERLENVPFEIQHTNTWQGYFDQFVEIYNYDKRKDRVKLLADGLKREIV